MDIGDNKLTKLIDAGKLEKFLVEEQNFLSRMFNTMYANKHIHGTAAVEALILESKVGVYDKLIDIVRKSVIEGK